MTIDQAPPMNAIARQRLVNQRLVHGDCETPADVVRTLGAVQAQNPGAALWSLGVRLPGVTREDVELAIAERHLVRTWALRGTLHLVAAADARWLPALGAARVLAGAAGREAQLELDAAVFKRGRRLLARALRDGPLTREAVYAALERGGVATTGQRGYHVLWRLGLEGFVCFGPPEGRQPTFTLVDAWLPPTPAPDREAALAELARRYFRSRGPATVHDFAGWAGLTVAEARVGLAAVATDLASLERDGQRYWLPQAAASAPCRRAPAALLLPAFDEYLLGYRERGAVLAPEHAGRVIPGGNGMFLPIMVLRGRVAGTWKAAPGKRSLRVDYAPFGRLTPADGAAFAVAARRYAAFLGLEVSENDRGAQRRRRP